MPTLLRRVAAPGLAAALVLALAAPVAAADEAMVRVLHGSPDTPSVDVYVDGTKVDALSGLEFGDLTSYVPLPAGSYAIRVCATAAPDTCPIDVPSLAVEAGTHYTIAATGLLAAIAPQVIADAPSPSSDATQVRVVHFSADTPAVDVLTQDGGTTVVNALAYPSATDYLDLPGGSYDLKVCADADNTVCPLDPGALDLANGRSYSVFAIGSLTGGSLTAAVGVDAVAAPATDTLAPATDGATPSAAGWAILALLALVGTVSALRYASVRARDR